MNYKNLKRRPAQDRDKRLHRILSILAILQGVRVSGCPGVRVSGCPGVRVSALADEFNVSPRQILRDLNSLSVAGFPLESVRGYRDNIWKLINT
jgi:F420-0:gamma-glutamyl ligase-like protein